MEINRLDELNDESRRIPLAYITWIKFCNWNIFNMRVVFICVRDV